MVGAIAEVISQLNSVGPTRYLVHYQGELWNAISQDTLVPGQKVQIVTLDGINLVVSSVREDSHKEDS